MINIIEQINNNGDKNSGIPAEIIYLTFLSNLKIFVGKAFINTDDMKILAIVSIKFLKFISDELKNILR